nr:aminoglycoside phosphotransferase family protein [Eubacterium sp.]
MNIDNIYRKYIKDEVSTVTLLSGGHINKTYLIETDAGNYICQCINKCMDIDLLENNYRLYSEACERNAREYPKILKSEEGSYFVTDNDGDKWRMYPVIEGEVLTNPLSEAELYECGKGLARMHEILSSVSAKPDAVYPHLHDLEFYYEKYKRLINNSGTPENEINSEPEDSREAEPDNKRDNDLEILIDKRYMEIPYYKAQCTDVIHGDAKLANILFRAGKAVAFIDFDTVMMGSRFEDIA